MVKKKEVILGVTASVAIYKACEITRRLRDEGCSVSVVMTKEARDFISPLLFASLSANKVYGDMVYDPQAWEIEHVSLADKADLVLIAPATANIIAKAACGICDDLLTCLISATKAPVLFCPAMNENMYLNKITQANIKKLGSLGYKFVQPRKGGLACGKVGVGCLAEVDTIIKEAVKIL
jgi:phosphopantothenoylcysteine decarboxylase / phosphopantothenate---cysteine ligase